MRSSSALLIIPALLACVWCAPCPAVAGDDRPVELPLVNGKTLKGAVQQIAGDEVVLALSGGKTRRVPWTQLTPLAVYRVKAALAPVTDGDARKKLAELYDPGATASGRPTGSA